MTQKQRLFVCWIEKSLQFNFQSGKVKVEVYYETLCPEVRYFIRSQLYPVWEELNAIMELHWKPYGKSQVST